MRVLAALVLWVSVLLPHSEARAVDHPVHWSRPAPAFRILDNVYYVGTEGLSAFLITGSEGHVLIDGTLPSTARVVADNIRSLGFDLHDVKYLLINHAHYDHAGGLAELKRLTRAELAASEADKADLEAGRTLGRDDLERFPPVKVDRVIHDGEQLRLGPIVLTAILTPGHTPGSTSWMTTAGGKRILFASSITVAGQKLMHNPAHPDVVADFGRTFAKLRKTQADVYLNFHTEGFDMDAKRARQRKGETNAFVDPTELSRRIDSAEDAFRIELAAQSDAARYE